MNRSSLHAPHWKHLTALLRDCRVAVGMTQAQLAEKLGVDQSIVSKIARSERRLDIIELEETCTALGISLQEFVRRFQMIRAPSAEQAQNDEGFTHFPEVDSQWSDEQWAELLDSIVANGLSSWMQITSLVLGHLNPSQVGTSIASKKSFQRHYEQRKTWRNVRHWHFEQDGKCTDCGSRLEIQADHMVPKEVVGRIGMLLVNSEVPLDDRTALQELARQQLDAHLAELGEQFDSPNATRNAICADLVELLASGEVERAELTAAADRLDNMVLRCRRCNVIRRPSHKHGGKTFLTAEAALMWILLVKRPRTYERFAALCRDYGLTMANVRFEEAWAMARWLQRSGSYTIDPDSKY